MAKRKEMGTKNLIKMKKLEGYSKLVDSIGELLGLARKQVARIINTILVETYWKIGERIVEYEQKGGEY